MLRQLIHAGLLFATLSAPLAACSTVQAVPTPGHIDANLLQPCAKPTLVADPQSDNDFAEDFIAVSQAYVACAARHQALIDAEKARGVK